MESFDEERRARLLQFVTGSSRVPLQGFKALQGRKTTVHAHTVLRTSLQLKGTKQVLAQCQLHFGIVLLPRVSVLL